MIKRIHNHQRDGFSLIEVSMVLVLSGFIASYVIMTTKPTQNQNCYPTTQAAMPILRDAIERFAQKNDRLPRPASLSVGVEDTTYGREGGGSIAGASTWGALPFQVLGLSPSYAADCWSNKFMYVVTTALTTNATTGGYLDPTIPGAITLKSSSANITNTTTSYAIISMGEDGLGAVKANGTSFSPCSLSNLSTINCAANSATVADAVFNDGKDAGANYFDDIIITKGRSANVSVNNAFGWGANSYGQIGDGTTVAKSTPTAVSNSITFKQITSNTSDTCGIDMSGNAYCWGYNAYGEVGDGTTSARTSPTLVAGHQFKQISFYQSDTCAIDMAGAAWCWGKNDLGQIGDGTTTQRMVPTAVIGGHIFSQISTGFDYTCALDMAGATWCWGTNVYGQIGDGTTTSPRTAPTAVLGAPVFTQISAAWHNTCGLNATGAAWCWGYNSAGELGDGTTITPRTTPVAVIGGHFFKQILSQTFNTCALDMAGKPWCWGENLYGEMGNGLGAPGPMDYTFYTSPTAVSGSFTFKQLNGTLDSTCGLVATGTAYCWGYGATGVGNMADNANVPTAVGGAFTFSHLAGNSTFTLLGIQGTPP